MELGEGYLNFRHWIVRAYDFNNQFVSIDSGQSIGNLTIVAIDDLFEETKIAFAGGLDSHFHQCVGFCLAVFGWPLENSPQLSCETFSVWSTGVRQDSPVELGMLRRLFMPNDVIPLDSRSFLRH